MDLPHPVNRSSLNPSAANGSWNDDRSTGSPRTPDPTEEAIRAWLVANVAEILEIEPQQIDVQQVFDYYGMDSMQAYILSGDLEAWLKRPLSPSVAWDYPTIDLLARHLASELLPKRSSQ